MTQACGGGITLRREYPNTSEKIRALKSGEECSVLNVPQKTVIYYRPSATKEIMIGFATCNNK